MHDAARRPEILPDFDTNGIRGGMLVLSRRVDERIVIDESIVITVIEVRGGNRVRLGIQAREGVNIRRAEIEPLPTTTTGGPHGSDQ